MFLKMVIKKDQSNTSIVFDDSCFDNIKGKAMSAERSKEIENLIMPNLLAELAALKKTNPLFQKKIKIHSFKICFTLMFQILPPTLCIILITPQNFKNLFGQCVF